MASPTKASSLDKETLQGPKDKASTNEKMQNTAPLEDLETEEQRKTLDVVAQVRKCGLDSLLDLPQIVVCGQQSAGKSSVLEALTEIPFPRNDNLCTRFATEIILRRGPSDNLSVKVIPDGKRPAEEQSKIKEFHELIENFEDLPRIMNLAMNAMGIDETGLVSGNRPFARDILSIEIEGLKRPQLTLVDIPGLIDTATKGISQPDIDMVNEITETYIRQPRTICLAVVSATSDYATQRVLEKVRDFDQDGERTLGVITKPDRLPRGSGSERSFIELAKNQDIFFKLGWHVVKNRSFEENDYDFQQRNQSEDTYFRTSNFRELPADDFGIEKLRSRLSSLLFEHVKRELPKLKDDLQSALSEQQAQLNKMGDSRSSVIECKNFLFQLSQQYRDVCEAGVKGNYDGPFFQSDSSKHSLFTHESEDAVRRLRALIQKMNGQYSDVMRLSGHKFDLPLHPKKSDKSRDSSALELDQEYEIESESEPEPQEERSPYSHTRPIRLKRPEALDWVRDAMTRTRGREITGTFNPLLIGELFREQSSKWETISEAHIKQVTSVCRSFLDQSLNAEVSSDLKVRLWTAYIEPSLNERQQSAQEEFARLIEDLKEHPINYNHYYSETIAKLRAERLRKDVQNSVSQASTKIIDENDETFNTVDIDRAVALIQDQVDPSMDNVSCDEALIASYSLYKVSPIFLSQHTVPQLTQYSRSCSRRL